MLNREWQARVIRKAAWSSARPPTWKASSLPLNPTPPGRSPGTSDSPAMWAAEGMGAVGIVQEMEETSETSKSQTDGMASL